MKTVHTLGYLIAFRIVNALVCTTFFQPDEFFQSLEVAHRLVFGYGWQTWEWRQDTALRSPLHAMLFVPPYWLVKVLGLEQTDAVIAAPKILQGAIAALNDYYTANLASKLFGGDGYRNVALFCSLASFFNAGATIRTFSNSLETTLTAAALCAFPWHGPGSYTTSILIAGISCIVRPTSAVLWVFLAISVAWERPSSLVRFFGQSILPLLCLAIDTWFYSRLTFTPLNFLRVNVVEQISLFYGANPWHFYLTQALPFDMLAMLPFTLHGCWLLLSLNRPTPARTAVRAAILTMVTLSLLSHKEFRFIQPLLPILHCASAYSLFQGFRSSPIPAQNTHSYLPNVKRAYVELILYVNIPAALFFICIHQKGQVTVADYIRHSPRGDIQSFGFLMPCHSTPWQSHIHRPDLELPNSRSGYGGKLWAITCEPPLNRNSLDYIDEDAEFHADPCRFVDAYLPKIPDLHFDSSNADISDSMTNRYTWPSHLAVFEIILSQRCKSSGQQFGQVLHAQGYVEEKRFWNTFLHEDPRRAGDVVVFRHSRHK